MERVIRTRKPVDPFRLMKSDDDRLIHQRAMAETAKPVAEWIAQQVTPSSDATRMVDIGGSQGVYSAAFCHCHSAMRSTIYELPEMVGFARSVSAELQTSGYCEPVGENYMDAGIDCEYDFAFLGNILHHFVRPAAGQFRRKVYESLAPDSQIVIGDLIDQSEMLDTAAACFSLLFYITSKGRCFEMEEIRDLVESAGFVDFRVIRPPTGATHVLIEAIRPTKS